jgi:hypothetical protein
VCVVTVDELLPTGEDARSQAGSLKLAEQDRQFFVQFVSSRFGGSP